MSDVGSNGWYSGGAGVIVRAPDFFDANPPKVVPGTFWSNDIFAPSQFYPSQSNIWFPNNGWDGFSDISSWQTSDLPQGPWTYAGVGVVVGTAMNQLYPEFDKIQENDWGWGVFYAADSNAADNRCERWDDKGGWDCPGGWLNDNGNFEQNKDMKGSGNYNAGNPTWQTPSVAGGGAGCHFDSGQNRIDQPDAAGNNLVGNANCECNYDLQGNEWADWIEAMVNNLQQKDGYQDRKWLGGNAGGSGEPAPSWALDSTICWVSNPRDLILMQNALFHGRQEWNNGLVPTSNWQTSDTAEMRKYWGWNEVPVDRETVDNAMNWDAIIVKLPADICSNNWGQEDSISCLGTTEQWALEGDLDSMVSSGKLLLGSSNMGSRPGSYIVVVREWGDPYDGDNGGVNWSRYFFCEDWFSPGGKYKIVHLQASDDPNGNGACYLDRGDGPSPTLRGSSLTE